MPETFDFDGRRDDFSAWAFIASMNGPNKAQEIIAASPGSPYTVEMKINGVDVSFAQVMKRLDENYDYHVMKAARALLLERAGFVVDAAHELHDKITQEVERLFPEK